MPNPETIRTCATCGTILPAEQLCFACALLQIAAPEPVERASVRFDPAALPCAFGSYEMRREIAVGGMGAVYEALDSRLGRTVAVKLMRSLLLSTADEKARFKTEAGAAAQLDHPNIVPVYEVGVQDGQPFFSMKLIEGGSLAERLKAGPLPEREAAVLMAKVARAVEHAHGRGVLHRDLKPGNILIDATGAPWLTDFGLAKVTASPSGLTLTQSFLGTPEYMSPEQAAGRTRDIGPASDVWALGAILFQMLSGRLPFAGESSGEVLRRVLEDEAPTLNGRHGRDGRHGPQTAVHRVHVAPDLATIVARCLTKDPARRISRAGFLAEELERWLVGEPIHSRGITSAERGVRWVRRHPWPVASAVLAAAVVALAVAFQRKPASPPPKPIIEFQNGSFETSEGDPSQTPTGWRFGGTASAVRVASGEGTTDGNFAAIFNCRQESIGGVLSQTFKTAPGQTYTVQFDFGTYGLTTSSFQKLQVQVRDGISSRSGAHLIQSGSGRMTTTSGGSIESNANTLVIADRTARYVSPEIFNRVTFTFTAKSATSTLTFTDVSTGDTSSQDGVLDNVVVTATATR